MTTRRDFLKLTLALTAATWLPSCGIKRQEPWFISCCTDKSGEHYAAAFTLKGDLVNQVRLPSRGHQVIAVPNRAGHAFVFARRPGNYLIEVDFNSGQLVQIEESEANQHFYGHGTLSRNGQILFTTENNFETQQGLVVVRDANTLDVLDKFDSGGIGPHELKLMPDGKTLVVANGGILTHPEKPREKLNLKSMKPNLSYLYLSDGQIINQVRTEIDQLSIRHLDVASNGKVVVGMQYQGPKNDLVPLVFSHHGEGELVAMKASDNQWRKMNQYTASVAIDSINDLVAVTCPRGDMISFWRLSSGELIKSNRIADTAGVALTSGGFVATNGKGHMLLTDVEFKKTINRLDNVKWDNHLSLI